MYFIQQKVSKGIDPPQVLSPDMIPPAERSTPLQVNIQHLLCWMHYLCFFLYWSFLCITDIKIIVVNFHFKLVLYIGKIMHSLGCQFLNSKLLQTTNGALLLFTEYSFRLHHCHTFIPVAELQVHLQMYSVYLIICLSLSIGKVPPKILIIRLGPTTFYALLVLYIPHNTELSSLVVACPSSRTVKLSCFSAINYAVY